MATKTARSIFVNLPVRDLERAKQFFAELGFAFNAQFTNEQAACMIISEHAYVMLLVEPFFKTFTQKGIGDATKQTEVINAWSCSSRAEVEELARKAFAAGATPAQPPQDHGFMYSESFYDLDGHHWEVLWMDPAALQPQ